MSLLFCDGFRHSGLGAASIVPLAKKWTSISGAQIVSNGANGGYGCTLGILRKTLFNSFENGTSFANMWKFRIDGITGGDYGSGAGCSFDVITTSHQLQSLFTVRLEPDGILSFFAGNKLMDRFFQQPIHAGVDYTFEVNVSFLFVTHGFIRVIFNFRLNGQLLGPPNALDSDVFTDGVAETRITSFAFTGSSKGTVTISHPFIYDQYTDPLTTYNITSLQDGAGNPQFWAGDCKIIRVKPNRDVQKQWSSTGANNWDQINDDGPADESTYVSSDTIGQVDTYDFEDVPTNLEILSVQQVIYGKKSDAGTREIIHRAGDTGTENFGAEWPFTSLADDFYYSHNARDNNPTDGTQWTPTSFNAKRFGQELDA